MKVFLCENIHPKARAYLESHGTVLSDWNALSQADAVLSRNLRIDKAFLDAACKLKVIGIHGTGTDGVDIQAAEQRGIQVFSTPHRNAQSVAELNVSLALNLARKLNIADTHIGTNAPAALQGTELFGKRAGFIGTGEIAKRTAKILCAGFGMTAMGISPSYTEQRAEGEYIACAQSLEQLLAESDYLFICAPLTADTKDLIGTQELLTMKKTAYLINCARGGIVNESALYITLEQRDIAGAACDVFETEPLLPEHPLLSLSNFIALPHIGANTEEALYRVGMAAAVGIVERLKKGKR